MARTVEDFIPEGLSKKDRKVYEREFARIRREQELKRRRRTSNLKRAGLFVLTVAVVTTVAVILGVNIRGSFVGPKNMLSDGLLLNGSDNAITAVTTAALQPGEEPLSSGQDYSKLLVADLYLDYGSTAAATFEKTNEKALESWVTGGYASLELHPIATGSSKNGGFSTRAANAIACVADAEPDSVLAVHSAILAKAAAEKPASIGTDDLVTLVTQAGVTDTTGSVGKCIQDGHFDAWVSGATDRAKTKTVDGKGVTSFAAVVDGTRYTGKLDDATAFESFVSDAFTKATGAASGSGSTTGDSGTTGGQ